MNKATHATDRSSIHDFCQIINVGRATADDFRRMGYQRPQQLIGLDPLDLYQRLCRQDDVFHDPCVLDVLIATIDYMNGNPPKKWWEYTDDRKQKYAGEVDALRTHGRA